MLEDALCENPDCPDPQLGYPCAICGKLTCVSCDMYYLVVDEQTGGYITDPNEIMKITDLEGNIAHQYCPDPQLRLD